MEFESFLIIALMAGVLAGMLVGAIFLFRRSQGRRQILAPSPVPAGGRLRAEQGIPESKVSRFLGRSQARVAWGGSGSAMLVCLIVYQGLVWISVLESGVGHILMMGGTGAWGRSAGMSIVLATAAVFAAAWPFCVPRLVNVVKGAVLGTLVGLLGVFIALAQIRMTAKFGLSPRFADNMMAAGAAGAAVASVLSAAAAFLIGGVLSSLVRGLPRPAGRIHRPLSEIMLWLVVVAVLCAVTFRAETMSLYSWGTTKLVHWYKTDPTYRLVPSVWKGKADGAQLRSFTLVIEEVGPDGSFTGSMEWSPGGRTRVAGKATANHLSLHTTGLRPWEGSADNYEDLWINGKAMRGTSSNDWYRLTAELEPVQERPKSAPAIATGVPSPQGAVPPQPPSAPLPISRAAQSGPAGAATVNEARSAYLCGALAPSGSSLQDGCWFAHALQLRQRTHCERIAAPTLRDDCLVAFAVHEANSGACGKLSSAAKVLACSEMMGSNCRSAADAQAPVAGCEAARTLRLRAESDWTDAGGFVFYRVREPGAAPQSWESCVPEEPSLELVAERSWCRLERVRRNDPLAHCGLLAADLKVICDAMLQR